MPKLQHTARTSARWPIFLDVASRYRLLPCCVAAPSFHLQSKVIHTPELACCHFLLLTPLPTPPARLPDVWRYRSVPWCCSLPSTCSLNELTTLLWPVRAVPSCVLLSFLPSFLPPLLVVHFSLLHLPALSRVV
mmetsp:Transcript_26928/g.56743  ORF Transcript_26928/g.56743 Transcript_26928/m.56743 type:complete len:134 (+) Transcript_26928:231-632(+)